VRDNPKDFTEHLSSGLTAALAILKITNSPVVFCKVHENILSQALSDFRLTGHSGRLTQDSGGDNPKDFPE